MSNVILVQNHPDCRPEPASRPAMSEMRQWEPIRFEQLPNAPIRTLLTWRRKTTAGKKPVVSKMVDTENARLSSRNKLYMSFEQQFSCLICWAPNLRMIYGSCQHRLCENCLYDREGNRRLGLERCPTCQRENAFPSTRPDVPEDNIEIQVQLGVRQCPNSGCRLQMWHWELQDHLQECRFVAKSLSETKMIKRKSLHDSEGGSEMNKLMILRSGAKKFKKLVYDELEEQRKTTYKLRPRRGKKYKTETI